MTEKEARVEFAKLHTPELDRLRTHVLTMNTAMLLNLFCYPPELSKYLGVANYVDMNPTLQRGIVAAAILAVGDEIDRRIPTPP